MPLDTLTQANREWSTRPADERFTSLTDMSDHFQRVRTMSRAGVVSNRSIAFAPATDDSTGGLVVEGKRGPNTVTNWAFGQLASLAGAPAGYLRTLPAPIAADALNYGIRFKRDVQDVGLLRTMDDDGNASIRAATGPQYGRIWNADITGALTERFGNGLDGDFRVPGEFGKAVAVTKNNTTLFASDRDMFVFLADERNRVEVANRRDGQPGSLARGFFIWNSEVGAATMGAAFFLFDYVCKNRIVWGAQQYKEIRLRHTRGAPDRWVEEISPVLTAYADSAAAPVERTIAAAQQAKIAGDLADFLKNRFTRPEIAAMQDAHLREEGRPIETVWDAVTGATAAAKAETWQDARVDMERRAGALLDMIEL